MMRIAARVSLAVWLAFGSWSGASAQSLDQLIPGIGRAGQPSRAAIQAEWERSSPAEILCVDNRLRRARKSINALIDRGIGPTDGRVASLVSDCRVEQLTAITAVQERSAPIKVPAPTSAIARYKAAYSVAEMQLGNNVDVGSADYRYYNCAPSEQYAGFTGCQRQTTKRSRSRRISESTSFIHAADGSAVYINQNIEPVAVDDNDAHDEISRLSEKYGNATLLATQDTRGAPSSLIASWGAVSLQPLDPARRAELASGTDNDPGILIDTIGSPRKSAHLGLPIYRLGGGAGYVWAASWNGRGRGALRTVAIDASRLPGPASQAKPSAGPAAIVPAPRAQAVVTAAPTSSPVGTPKPADTSQPPPSIVVQSAQKAGEPAPVAAPQAKTPAAAATQSTDVRVVGPPIALHPTASAANPAPTPASSADGNGLMILQIALIVALLGSVGYFFRNSRVAPPAAVAVVDAVPTPTPGRPREVDAASEKMDLKALVPNESPANVACSAASPRADEAMVL